MKIPFNTDSLFQIIKCDTFDVSFLKYNTQFELNEVEKSFFFSEYAFAMDKYNYFKAESYIPNIFTKKLEVVLPIGQFISSNNKDVRTLVVLFERIIDDTTILKNVVFFNVKNDSLRSICSASESSVENVLKNILGTSFSTYYKNNIFFIKQNTSHSGGIDGFTYYTEKNIFKRITQADFWENLFLKKEEIIYFYTTYFINKNGCIENCYNVRKEDFPDALKIK